MKKVLPATLNIADKVTFFSMTYHASQKVELLCHKNPEFIAADVCPPNSLDLNPVNYYMWGVMQKQIYANE